MQLDSQPSSSPIETTFQVVITAATATVTEVVTETVTTENTAPTFTESLEVFQVIYKTVEAESWTYTFPATSDPDGDTVVT